MGDLREHPGSHEPPLQPLNGFKELLSPAWRIWYRTLDCQAEQLVYITAGPESFTAITWLIAEIAAEQAATSIAQIRMARDPGALEQINRQPEWAGKAFTFFLTTADEALRLAQRADVILAGRSLHGPPALRAKPFGGRSGLVFLRQIGATPAAQTDARRDRLSALLGGAGS